MWTITHRHDTGIYEERFRSNLQRPWAPGAYIVICRATFQHVFLVGGDLFLFDPTVCRCIPCATDSSPPLVDVSEHKQAWAGALGSSEEMLAADVLLFNFIWADEVETAVRHVARSTMLRDDVIVRSELPDALADPASPAAVIYLASADASARRRVGHL